MSAALALLLQHNAALIAVLAPVIGAALAILMPRGRWAAAPMFLAAAVAAAATAELAIRTLTPGAPSPIAESGLALRLDGAGVFAAALAAALAALTALAAAAHLTQARTAPFSAAAFLIALAGWLAACFAGDLVTLFLAVETGMLASIAFAALGADEERAALGGALRALVANAIAAAFMLLGVALLARALGGASFADLAAARVAAPGAAAAGAALILFALAMKAGVAPLHAWTGAFYGRGAPLAAAAFGAVGVVALLAAFVRVAAHVFALPSLGEALAHAVLALGLASVVIGSLQAAGARDVRRLAAYATAAQAGCLLVAVAMGSPASFASALVQLCAIGVGALALLIAAPVPGALSALDGLGRRAPLTSIAMTAGALSLMGAPLTLGFLGRWRLIEAGVGGGWWWAAGAVIVTSLAAVFYGGRLIERMYFRRAAVAHERAHEPWRIFLIPALAAATIGALFGADPAVLLRAADGAARFLTGVAG